MKNRTKSVPRVPNLLLKEILSWQFRELELESKRFAVRMLDLCKNTKEAVLLLAIDFKLDHYYEREVRK